MFGKFITNLSRIAEALNLISRALLMISYGEALSKELTAGTHKKAPDALEERYKELFQQQAYNESLQDK